MNQDHIRGAVAVLAGCCVIVLGDTLLGVQIEIFRGIATFNILWMVDVFLVPFVAGLLVAFTYKKRAGKYLAFLPPVIVRCLSCIYLYLTDPQWNADFFFHLHLHYWGLAVILSFKSSYLGANWGCVMVGAYRRQEDVSTDKDNRGSKKHIAPAKSYSQLGDNA